MPANGPDLARRIARAREDASHGATALEVAYEFVGLARFAVGAAVDALAHHLLRIARDRRGGILEARVKTQGYEEPTYVDIVDMVENLAKKVPDEKLRLACAKVRAAVGKAVVANDRYGGAVRRSSGLSIWYPLLKNDYVTRRSEYVALRYSSDHKNWSGFLDPLLAD